LLVPETSGVPAAGAAEAAGRAETQRRTPSNKRQTNRRIGPPRIAYKSGLKVIPTPGKSSIRIEMSADIVIFPDHRDLLSMNELFTSSH
jgi:hypothetical protein